MSEEQPLPPERTAWQAKNWEEVRLIWDGLVPEGTGELTLDDRSKIERTFRSMSLTSNEYGPVFERWVLEAFRLSEAEVHPSFSVPMEDSSRAKEQIDGLVLHGQQAYLIESKFWPKQDVDFTPIAKLHLQVEQRPAGALGLFFSAFGYSAPALELAGSLRPIRVLLFDQSDLRWAMDNKPAIMMEMVRRKWVAAVKYGIPNFRIDEEHV